MQQKQSFLKRIVALFDPAGVKKYITQVSLILVSLFIATRVDRWREANKDHEKLKAYLTAVQLELKDEIETCKMNLSDCDRDLKCLGYFMHYAPMSHPDSQAIALQNFREVYERGVFRSFPPATFEIMSETGDIQLLKNAELRSLLASAYSFRRTVVKKDLEDFDAGTQVCAKELGEFVNLTELCFMADYHGCVMDRKKFQASSHNEVFLLLRMANLRAFHLSRSIEEWEDVEKSLAAYIKSI
ncbi:MAG: hypothetical protein JNJ57_21865 [Saprospiraceae bacterium]|nr:hypothetical protein [Saprospiraceae bacterium]